MFRFKYKFNLTFRNLTITTLNKVGGTVKISRGTMCTKKLERMKAFHNIAALVFMFANL